MKLQKLLAKALSGSKDIRFSEASTLALGFGFALVPVSGSHHFFAHPDIPELVNLQDVAGKAKPYQTKQLLKLVERYSLSLEDE